MGGVPCPVAKCQTALKARGGLLRDFRGVLALKVEAPSPANPRRRGVDFRPLPSTNKLSYKGFLDSYQLAIHYPKDSSLVAIERRMAILQVPIS